MNNWTRMAASTATATDRLTPDFLVLKILGILFSPPRLRRAYQKFSALAHRGFHHSTNHQRVFILSKSQSE